MPANATTMRVTQTVKVPMNAPDDPPKIVRIRYDDSVARGPQSRFTGTIWTGSNVASVEVRTNLFSIGARKTDVGRFDFGVDVYDLPPIFIRPYTLRIIARNAAGTEAEEDLPLRIR
jgi:hypothetical protein